ncbi:MAG: hypothetical protein HUJ76_06660 [Parasporobacterium sp.]|nr:hypothetical protein [Parasporobacterium sp.]
MRKSLIILSPSRDNQVRIKNEIWLSHKKYRGLYILGIGAVAISVLISFSGIFDINARSDDLPQSLWVDFKASDESRILIKNDCVYEIDDMVRMEIPAEVLGEEELSIQVFATDTKGNRYLSRKFKVRSHK